MSFNGRFCANVQSWKTSALVSGLAYGPPTGRAKSRDGHDANGPKMGTMSDSKLGASRWIHQRRDRRVRIGGPSAAPVLTLSTDSNWTSCQSCCRTDSGLLDPCHCINDWIKNKRPSANGNIRSALCEMFELLENSCKKPYRSNYANSQIKPCFWVTN